MINLTINSDIEYDEILGMVVGFCVGFLFCVVLVPTSPRGPHEKRAVQFF